MKVIDALLFSAAASAMVFHDVREPAPGTDSTSSSPLSGLRVTIYDKTSCAGDIVGILHQDRGACIGASRHNGAPPYLSAKADNSGPSNGVGCLTLWETPACTGASTVVPFKANQCINFGSNKGCVVASYRDSAQRCPGPVKPTCQDISTDGQGV